MILLYPTKPIFILLKTDHFSEMAPWFWSWFWSKQWYICKATLLAQRNLSKSYIGSTLFLYYDFWSACTTFIYCSVCSVWCQLRFLDKYFEVILIPATFTRVFPACCEDGGSPPSCRNFAHPPLPGKIPPSRLPHQIFITSHTKA